MVNIIRETDMGTADAMITNLILTPNLPLIITADTDGRDAILDDIAPHTEAHPYFRWFTYKKQSKKRNAITRVRLSTSFIQWKRRLE